MTHRHWRAVALRAVIALLVGLMLAGKPLAGAQSSPLEGSFDRALALRRANPADVTGQSGQVIVLTPDAIGGNPVPVAASDQAIRLLGWLDGGLFFLRAAVDGTLDAIRADLAASTETVLATGLPATYQYALEPGLTPGEARVISWPGGPLAPLTEVLVYEAATLTPLRTVVVPEGLIGAALAGIVDGQAVLYATQGSDRIVSIDLATGALRGPAEGLAAGDGPEQLTQSAVAPGMPLVLVGRLQPKQIASVYTLDSIALGVATPHEFPDSVQRVVWRPDGRGAAIVASVPGDFSASTVFLTDTRFGSVSAPVNAAYAGCVLFTPDSRWLLFVSPESTTLQAMAVSAPGAAPQTLLRGEPGLDLCSAAWQPAPPTGAVLPEEGPLQPGQARTGEITDDAYAVDIPLALTAGDVVTITLERAGGDLDPFLLLLDPQGRELARNDDAIQQVGESPMNAQLLNFTAPETGTYTVRATRFFEATGLTRGAFRLSVTAGPVEPLVLAPTPVPPTPIPQVTPVPVLTPTPLPQMVMPILPGDTLTGTITHVASTILYTIDLRAGEMITVTLERVSGDLDPYLTLRGPSGRELAFNDDAEVPIGGIPINAQIRGFRAPEDGTYTIEASRYGGQGGVSTGDFRLSVTSGQALLPAATLQPGQTVEGVITDAQPVVEYIVLLEAGQTITVTLEALDAVLDPYLILLDSNGTELAFNDDADVAVGSSTYNAQIANWTAPATDAYTIRATRYLQTAGLTAGPFRLSLTAAGGTTVDRGVQIGPELQIGAVVTGAVTNDVYAVDYAIRLAAGQTIAVTLEALDGDLDALVILYDPEDALVSYNDDSVILIGENSLNARIAGYTALTSGLYTIRATRLNLDEGTTTGRFELRVEPGQAVRVADGGPVRVGDAPTGGLTTTVFAIDYTITLAAGESITILMENSGGDLDPALIIYDAAGNELAFNDDADVPVTDSELDARIAGFTPQQAGTYIIRATRYLQEGGTSTGRFRLHIEAGLGEETPESNK